jgi:hypothetical protein
MRSLWLVGIAVISSAIASSVTAVPVKYNFTTAPWVHDQPGLPKGSTVEGSFSYDPDAPFIYSPIPESFIYGSGSITATFGGVSVSGDRCLVSVLNGQEGDTFGIRCGFPVLTGVDALTREIYVHLGTYDRSFLDNRLPPILPELSAFDFAASVSAHAFGSTGTVFSFGLNFATLTQDGVEPVPTPEPAPLALLGLGCLGVAASRRRRTR